MGRQFPNVRLRIVEIRIKNNEIIAPRAFVEQFGVLRAPLRPLGKWQVPTDGEVGANLAHRSS